jgi:hypothetical protein
MRMYPTDYRSIPGKAALLDYGAEKNNGIVMNISREIFDNLFVFDNLVPSKEQLNLLLTCKRSEIYHSRDVHYV